MAPSRSRTARRIAWIACFLLAASAVGWQVWRRRQEPSTEVVDIRQPLTRLLEERGREPAPPPLSEGSGPLPLVREPLDEATAKVFFPSIGGGRYVYDPALIYRCASNLALRRSFAEHPDKGWTIRTNSLGMREDGEPSAVQPDLRILVTGASNVEGVCANYESAANVLEAALRDRLPGRTVETLNAGVGSSCFYNYLAVLERYRTLRPNVFVLIANGGTDFINGLALERYFRRRGPWPPGDKSSEALEQSSDPFVRQLVGTELGQVTHMIAYPEDLDVAVDLACSVSAEIEKACRGAGIRFLCVYLPPPLAGQPALLEGARREAMERLGITAEQIEVSDRLADRWLGFLREQGIVAVDMRTAWRATSERMYWNTDTHINLAGQRSVAAALLEKIDAR
jgi:hypothetical protein